MAEFDEELFENRLETLKDTQEGIQQLSAWCLSNRKHHKKIVSCWLNILKKVNIEHRLTLFYLANDVIQYSKRKQYEFVESWATALQRATTMVRDDKVKNKILRILNIWEERDVYNDEYLSDLRGLLNIRTPKKTRPIIEVTEDVQHANLITNIRDCVNLSNVTDKSFKRIPKGPAFDVDELKLRLRDKKDAAEIRRNVYYSSHYMEAYNKNLQAEIKSRKSLLANLENAIQFYAQQRGEVKVVVNAYKSFGNRVNLVKKKLDEMMPTLSSPVPSPDINAPSPEPDVDLQLPEDKLNSVDLIKNSFNGYTSYLDGNLPFDLNDFKRDDNISNTPSQPIEVISSRSDDESFNSSSEYYKAETINSYASSHNVPLGNHNPMPVPPVQSEYTSLARSSQQYNNVLSNSQYNNAYSTHIPGYTSTNYSSSSSDSNSYCSTSNPGVGKMLMLPPPTISSSRGDLGNGAQANNTNNFNSWDMSWNSSDTPVSPPHFEREAHNSATIEYSETETNLSVQDVDHRKMNVSMAVKLGLSKDKNRQLDIDHRNLISLTDSPVSNDSDKKSWISAENNYHTNKTGDIDYRTGLVPIPKSSDVNEISSPNTSFGSSPAKMPSSNFTLLKSPTEISNTSSSSESQKEDNSGHDPVDMVIDMDMSDDDLDDIIREVAEQHKHEDQLDKLSTTSDEKTIQIFNTTKNHITNSESSRTALLETPLQYVQQNAWSSTVAGQTNASGYIEQNMGSNVQYQQDWSQMHLAWNGNASRNDADSIAQAMCVPPPPRPPLPFQFQYNSGNAEYDNEYNSDYSNSEYAVNNNYTTDYRNGVGNGTLNGNIVRTRGRGWTNSAQYQYRPYAPRGARGVGARFNYRGARGMGNPPRGAFRGKYRANIHP